MEHHPVAAALATLIAGRDPQRLAVALTETARLRALLPRGPIEVHGREDVAACLHDLLADFDTVQLIESAGGRSPTASSPTTACTSPAAPRAGCAPRPQSAPPPTAAWQ